MVEKLLTKEDVLINGRSEGKSPLLLSAKKNQTEVVSILLENGADVHIDDEYGNTPLLYAAEYLNLELAIILKRFGACIDCKNQYGETEFYY